MNDAEILEKRKSLIDLINKKDAEWDRYRAKYAGVPEYWEVQKNAYNEIRALRSELYSLPMTSSEKWKRNIKIFVLVSIFLGISLFFVIRWFF